MSDLIRARYIGDVAVDELTEARCDTEARLDRIRRRIVRALEHGVPLRELRGLLLQLRDGRVQLALIADLERALRTCRAEESVP